MKSIIYKIVNYECTAEPPRAVVVAGEAERGGGGADGAPHWPARTTDTLIVNYISWRTIMIHTPSPFRILLLTAHLHNHNRASLLGTQCAAAT